MSSVRIEAPAPFHVLFGADGTRFNLVQDERGCKVSICWSDGTIGPEVAFQSETEARLWVQRDADAWIKRLAISRQG